MDTYINTDEVLVQTKSELSKEYFFLKKRIQSEKEQSDSSNLSGDLIYDLVDKQFLLIQELFKKYAELKSEVSIRKMVIATKATVLREMHDTVLNRLLERNYNQENKINDLIIELKQLKEKEFRKTNQTKSLNQMTFIPINHQGVLFTERKPKAINVYNYNVQNKYTSSLTLNATAPISNLTINNSNMPRVLITESGLKDLKINNLKVKLNSMPRQSLKSKKKNKMK